MRVTGGLYVYLREAYGPLCAFVSGWISREICENLPSTKRWY